MLKRDDAAEGGEGRRAEVVEESAQGRGGAVFARPHQPPGVMIDHDEQVPLGFAVGDLIDADPAQPS